MREVKDLSVTRSGVAPGDAAASAMLREAEAWARMQTELVGGIETLWTDWLRRRCEAMQAASRTLQKICESRTLGEVARAQQEWLSGTIERTAADMGDWVGGTAVWAGKRVDVTAAGSPIAAPRQAENQLADHTPQHQAAK
jgi:hypothetical protein